MSEKTKAIPGLASIAIFLATIATQILTIIFLKRMRRERELAARNPPTTHETETK